MRRTWKAVLLFFGFYLIFYTLAFTQATDSITISAPTSGETIQGGTTYPISWDSIGTIPYVELAYSLDNGANWTTIDIDLNTGIFNWNVPSVDSTQCLVRIRDAADNDPSDTSGVFTITTTPSNNITITSPNGGEVILGGATFTITWTTTATVTNVQLAYSLDNGTNWTTIATVSNSGSYDWTVPVTTSSQCLIRVRDAADNDPSDTSDAVFSIVEFGSTISITSPTGGEYWEVGTVHQITWISGSAVGDNVKLEYSVDNQATWTTIISSTDNDGAYDWTIPNAPSETCNIRITDVANNTISNISYGTFSIVSISGEPEISLNHFTLYYGALKSSTVKTGIQTIIVNNTGSGILQWQASVHDQDQVLEWLKINNITGTQSGRVEVTVEPVGLPVGSYSGRVVFTDPNASNSPQTVWVYLGVYAPQSDSDPFGTFETPENNSTVRSSIPVTGWVLDDIGIQQVTIWRDGLTSEPKDEYYIGKAALVEGTRPDVEQAYPGYPMNYKAGWGYMMLTNMLPNGGNGTFKLHAYAKDLSGNEVYLGSKTIMCDNAHAVKPFGAIDTPGQGGDATGTDYRNQGWVLTPMPNKIPEDGSTIAVYIDGQNIGTVTYNIFRLDIATLFPGYANSNGALAYLDFDTTAYVSGLHTIQWVATDNAGNSDGIGSRYFVTIQNTGYTGQSAEAGKTWHDLADLSQIPAETVTPVKVKTGYKENAIPTDLNADENGVIHITIHQDERLVLDLNQPAALFHTGYLEVKNRLRPLPPGASLDRTGGILYWQPGPASLGKYPLVFISKGPTDRTVKKNVIIEIIAKFTGQKDEKTQ